MKCPVCKKQKLKSKVFSRRSKSTLMAGLPYYDENGKYHDHDPNITTTGYECSNGHVFEIKSRKKCMSCDYGGDIEIIIIKEK